jgi:hypothetical protein
MDRDGVGDGASFTMASRPIRVFRDAGGVRSVAARFEGRMSPDLIVVETRALVDVRLDEELAGRTQKAGDLVEERAADDETLLVPFFPPWVGEMQENGVEHGVGSEPRQREAHVVGEHAAAWRDAEAGQAFIDEGGPLAPNFETDHGNIGTRHQAVDDETAAPGANLELESSPGCDERAEVDAVTLG